MVRQAKNLGRVGFQPVLDTFRGEAGKFTQPPLALGEFREYLDPAIGNRSVLKPEPTLAESTVGLLHKRTKCKLSSAVSFRDLLNSSGIRHFEKRRRLTSDLCGLDSLGQAGSEAGDDRLLQQFVRNGGQEPFSRSKIDAEDIGRRFRRRSVASSVSSLKALLASHAAQNAAKAAAP